MTDNQTVITPPILAFEYTFLKLLGEGANGKTWLGRSKIDGQLVAIKELKTSVMEDLKSLDLFKREAETLQSIKMQGVPRFYDSIFAEDEQACYLIQEYIPYPSIADLLKEEGKFIEAETLNILEKLACILLILQTQYSPPIIHRDIKPSNLLCKIENDMSDIQLALIDFGAVANPQKRTGGSTIAGTFGYMAPEQLQGECCIQSDFYAMGATAVHMLSNISPYNMPSDVFKLDYKPTLYREAPEVSRPMIELLDFLLAPKVSDRPKSAEDNLLSPNSVTMNGKSSSAIKYYHFPTTPDESWINSEAIARRFSFIGDKAFIEFTYRYKDKMYVCLDSHPVIGNKTFGSISFPIECKIAINPADPHISYICCINGVEFTHPEP